MENPTGSAVKLPRGFYLRGGHKTIYYHNRKNRSKEMMRYLKILVLAIIVIGIFVRPANAVQLLNRNGTAFGTGTNINTSYAIGLEAYSKSAGVYTIADDGTSRGLIQIAFVQNHSAEDTVNLVISSRNAFFNSAGPGYKLGLCDVAANANNVCDPGEIVGFLTPSGATLTNLGITLFQNITAPRTLWLVQWRDNVVADNQYTAGESLLNGTGLFVSPGLNASCDNRPIITVSFSSPHEITSTPFNFAVFTPQFTGTRPGENALTAEVNTETNLGTFVPGSGPNVYSVTEIQVDSFIDISDVSDTKDMWIAYTSEGNISNIGFNVNSVVGEPNASLYLDGTYCRPSDDSKVFFCLSYAPLVGNHNFFLQVDGYSTNKPTTWTLSNFVNVCVTFPSVVIGVWYGVIFDDVPPDYWAEDYINAIFNVNITTGCSQSPLKYCPEDYVTREQMAVFIVRALEGEPSQDYCDSGVPFPDVSSDMWSCRYIKRLKELEITTGYSDGTYGPYDEVLREQMAAFLVRVGGEPSLDYCYSGTPFPDVSSDMWSCRYIKRLYELGITTGYQDGTYGPYDLVTRAQMAAFLARAFLEME